MDKEKFLTIGIGLFVGITIAGMYFFITSYLPSWQKGQPKVTFSPTNNQKPADGNQLTVTIDKPDDHSSTTSSEVSVNGRAQPGTKLILFSNADEKVASSDANGNFTISVKLEDGENQISVTAVDSLGNLTIAKRNVTLEISQ